MAVQREPAVTFYVFFTRFFLPGGNWIAAQG
jgi:hypothetical protein